MNNSTRKMALALAAAAVLALTGCGGGSKGGSGGAGGDAGDTAAKTYSIGITQYVAHPSLDAITQGFKDALEEKGVKANYTYEDAQGESANTTTIAAGFAEKKFDLIMAVATPSAQAMVNQVEDVPVLFAGVTDPVAAGLARDWEASGTNVTGTSDLNPEGKPAGLIQEAKPDTKTIGYIYSLGEQNSVVQLEVLKKEADALGMSVKEAGVANGSELATAVQTLKGVDALYVGTDNTVVNAIETVVDFAETNQVPLFVGDSASVERGGVATRGIDYYELGKRTGEIAADILLNGKDPGQIPPLQVKDTEVVVNVEAAKKQGLELSDKFLEGTKDVSGSTK